MKKILLVALAAATMVGCAQNEEIENAAQKAEISFKSVVKAGTKADITDNDNFNVFTVSGFKTAGAMDGTTVLAAGFMDDVEVTKAAGWKPSETFYWPLEGKVQFFATSPAQTLTVGTGYPTFEYTVKDVVSQEDLVAANQVDKDKSSGSIVLPFQHLLTQVNFTIKGATPDFTYVVSKIVIKGAKDKATFTFNGTSTVGAWTALVASAADLSYSATGTFTVAPTTADPDAETKLETAEEALFMLMPQALDAVTLEVTYTAAPTAKPSEFTYNDTKTLNLTGSWGMGKSIRYTLALTNNAAPIEFGDPSVGGWDTESDGTVTE